jgi:hypothetical protein
MVSHELFYPSWPWIVIFPISSSPAARPTDAQLRSEFWSGASGSHLWSWLLGRLRSGGSLFKASPGNQFSKVIGAKWTGGMDEAAEHLLCKLEALSSNPLPQKDVFWQSLAVNQPLPQSRYRTVPPPEKFPICSFLQSNPLPPPELDHWSVMFLTQAQSYEFLLTGAWQTPIKIKFLEKYDTQNITAT